MYSKQILTSNMSERIKHTKRLTLLKVLKAVMTTILVKN